MRFLRSKMKKGDNDNVTVSFYSRPDIKIATLIVSDFNEPGTLMFHRRTGRREFLTEFIPNQIEKSEFSSSIPIDTNELFSLLSCPDTEDKIKE